MDSPKTQNRKPHFKYKYAFMGDEHATAESDDHLLSTLSEAVNLAFLRFLYTDFTYIEAIIPESDPLFVAEQSDGPDGERAERGLLTMQEIDQLKTLANIMQLDRFNRGKKNVTKTSFESKHELSLLWCQKSSFVNSSTQKSTPQG